ncbi:DUF4381 domain-containing protein [Thalassotalea sp. PLHSN55]|uniref:DUF4381 domain-containing protein n=1 Tax=Thalassotalea sp. PLHSN55 TaxID=3435888 RepID=UPI003F835FA5
MEHKPPSSYLLKDFFDVTVPESVSWLPQTMGWKILLVALLCGLGYVIYQRFLLWRKNKYRRDAISAIGQLDSSLQNASNELFSIMKKALVQINSLHAPLFGRDFLLCLDQYQATNAQVGELNFSSSLGEHWLDSLLVSSITLTPEQNQQLTQLCLTWLESHQVRSEQ